MSNTNLNVDLLEKLYTRLTTDKKAIKKFNMDDWRYCIHGNLCAVLAEGRGDTLGEVIKSLGIDSKQYLKLCIPATKYLASIKLDGTLKVIRHLIDTGEVDWSVYDA